jgi:O-antigen ligase
MRPARLINNYKFQYWFAFLQAFPTLMIVTNLSFIVFIRLYFSFRKLERFKISSIYQIIAILFGIGAILSTADANEIKRSLAVLPNFLYWSLLIILFYNYRNIINFKITREAIYKGLITLNIYYWLVEKTLRIATPFNKFVLENGYAILMICFVPTALKYVLVEKGKNKAYMFALVAIILGFISGSRAGVVLIAGGALLTLFGENLSLNKVIQMVLIGAAGYLFIFQTEIASDFLFNTSPDVHELVYNSDQVFEEDPSVLIRKAMVEKGLILFEKEPFTGLGLNNWPEYEVTFRGDFVGAERIFKKLRLEKFSAHNSYIAFLGEGGLFVFVPFVLLLVFTILRLLFKLEKLDQYQQPILWSLIMMSIHIYFISAMLNSFTWYLIALGVAAGNKNTP